MCSHELVLFCRRHADSNTLGLLKKGEVNASMLNDGVWLEVLDPRHRYGSNLNIYYKVICWLSICSLISSFRFMVIESCNARTWIHANTHTRLPHYQEWLALDTPGKNFWSWLDYSSPLPDLRDGGRNCRVCPRWRVRPTRRTQMCIYVKCILSMRPRRIRSPFHVILMYCLVCFSWTRRSWSTRVLKQAPAGCAFQLSTGGSGYCAQTTHLSALTESDRQHKYIMRTHAACK